LPERGEPGNPNGVVDDVAGVDGHRALGVNGSFGLEVPLSTKAIISSCALTCSFASICPIDCAASMVSL
jgi:hypothetical protein